jgi:hypothetical protein
MKFGNGVPVGAEKRSKPVVSLKSEHNVASISAAKGSMYSIEFVESQ